MERQLLLIDDEAKPDWKLDESAKELGRRGVAAAREALRQAHREALVRHDANRAA